ncbi:XRE family transcriptional regulator [Jeongeupia naejangsanensis]|uniref:Helix-turn-helix transcriptional regulator n=1 Tax=Jeongeupia naejangsanensis TaxID=613195 RepID=A0ABS2BH89_9NEIS|nr:helix-turn-helix transcriptional regulator [Jeongeupia naejangsanensis]MBM3114986.1 helix-turn-helix transcriptional regulator [Jeongeupia naejangsanensis]
MNTFADRVRQRRTELGLSQKELAKRAGVGQSAIGNIESGRNKSATFLPQLADALGVDPLWLVGDGRTAAQAKVSAPVVAPRPVTVWDNEDELDPDGYVFLPRLDVQASCGNGKLVWEIDEKGQRNAFRRAWAERLGVTANNAATILAEGDSMEERIHEGDSLVIDYTQRLIQDGKVYALCWQGEFFVKRLYKAPGGAVILHSDNEAKYAPRTIPAEYLDELEIVGRVVAISGAI